MLFFIAVDSTEIDRIATVASTDKRFRRPGSAPLGTGRRSSDAEAAMRRNYRFADSFDRSISRMMDAQNGKNNTDTQWTATNTDGVDGSDDVNAAVHATERGSGIWRDVTRCRERMCYGDYCYFSNVQIHEVRYALFHW